MSERFSFAVDRHVPVDRRLVTVEGGVAVWQQDSALTTTLNESYVTCAEDSPTQYLSVLDTSSEISLDNLGMTLANPKLKADEDFLSNDIIEQTQQEEAGEQHVVVYTIDGSDDLYGIQVAQDEEGNLQKYHFQLRKNDDGQLEAITETIQLLPIDQEVHQINDVETDVGVEGADNVHIFVQGDSTSEHILPDRDDDISNQETHESLLYENAEIVDEALDIKPTILSLQNIKQELLEAGTMDDEIGDHLQEPHFAEASEELADTDLIQYENADEQNPLECEEENIVDEEYHEKEAEVYEHIEVNPDLDVVEDDIDEPTDALPDHDSDVEDYQIVEGLHITGDVEAADEVGQEKVAHDANTNILKHALNTQNEQKPKKENNKVFLYVVQHPEKENVDSLSLEMSNLCKPRVNPRSILKSSHVLMQSKNDAQDERMNKRFARCKEAVQARNFHNFINKTTIPQAPVRKDRLPRKQKIKPVERIDEEIVVQEVMVSSNRFVEMYGGAALVNKENLEVTEYVELSDSDDDYNPKKTATMKKKKKHRRRKVVTISDESDDDDSHDSVIELESDDEDSTPTKKARESLKRCRLVDNPTKPEIPCPKCDKTFPSQNSLKTHLQHHSLQTTIKNALPESKYKCGTCGAVFKNGVLLKRHVCAKSLPCAICKKKFADVGALSTHKRLHAKEQLLKSTSAVQVSPKKLKPAPSSPSGKRAPASCKCKSCGKLCSSLQNLNIHMKSHKDYGCPTCLKTFVSQLLLEKHVRENCVKSPEVARRRMRSMLPVTRSRTVASSPALARLRRVKCDKCDLEFVNQQAVVKHQVLKHADDVSEKSALKGVKGKVFGEHGGVPPARSLRNAFGGLTCQLDLIE